MSGHQLLAAAGGDVQPGGSNPFSFREFLRCKDRDQDRDQDREQERDPDPDRDREQTHSKSSCSQRLFDVGDLTFDPEGSSCFFSPAPQEEQWGQRFQAGVGSTSCLCTEEEDEEEEETRFSSKADVQQRRGAEIYEGDAETSVAEPVNGCRRKSSHVKQLKEENMSLRRTLRDLQMRSDTNERRVLELSEELLRRRRREEEEAQDLESMVHSVERNLTLMTKRAVKAENVVSKLTVQLQQLQVEAETLRLENSRLNALESQVVMTMKQNAQVASEYLNKTASHAHSSIRRLLEEAETLRLVSQLLQSIDKISSLSSES